MIPPGALHPLPTDRLKAILRGESADADEVAALAAEVAHRRFGWYLRNGLAESEDAKALRGALWP